MRGVNVMVMIMVMTVAVAVAVAVAVVMTVVVVVVMAPTKNPAPNQLNSHAQHQQSTGQLHPREDLIRRQHLGQTESNTAKSKHGDGMRRRHNSTKNEGVPVCATLTQQIGGHQRLAMTG